MFICEELIYVAFPKYDPLGFPFLSPKHSDDCRKVGQDNRRGGCQQQTQ